MFKRLLILVPIILTGCNLGGTTQNTPPAMCGTVAYPTSDGYTTPSPILESTQVWSFMSAPELSPMKISVDFESTGLAAGSIFAAPYSFSADATYGQAGSLIMDESGNPIWFHPTNNVNLMNTNFKVQSFYGQSVLTFWQGTLATPPSYTNIPAGSSEPGSCYYIMNNNYQVIQTVTAQNGFTSDIHEFLLTPDNTALFLATKTVAMDLTPYGGSQNGMIQDFSVQEVNLTTNELVFFWDALEHISPGDSYESASSTSSSGGVWDAYHMNSISLTENPNDILVSGRNTSTIYRINKPTGNIEWYLGGKQSSFTIESAADFSWQHDAEFVDTYESGDIISMFDDNCCGGETVPPGTPYSHGLFLQLNLNTMTASMESSYYHNPNLNVQSQGDLQSLSNGNIFVGWGQSAYFSEFAPGGNESADPTQNLLYDAIMPGNNYSYRTYKYTWSGTPTYPPSLAIESALGQTTAYVSWNGSTATAAWIILSGNSQVNLSNAESAVRAGFETAIPLAAPANYYAAEALDSSGNVIGTSNVISAAH